MRISFMSENTLPNKDAATRRIRSFVRRDGRMTEAQKRVLEELWPHFGLTMEIGMLDFKKLFERNAPCLLEIGFGSGYSLLEIARAHPDKNFIGIETYQPGIGSLLLGIEEQGLTNIRIFYHDAVEVLEQCIPPASLDGVQIFFPDPWPKRRHHKRRLIQPEFVNLIVGKLKPQGVFHLATDWEHYAKQMMRVLSQTETLINLAGAGSFAERSMQRPIVTKFEQRGTKNGRPILELQFARA
jgi:tRNA (guanine-N7-)-methyltransferase